MLGGKHSRLTEKFQGLILGLYELINMQVRSVGDMTKLTMTVFDS